jgi:ankyrin repeat protein
MHSATSILSHGVDINTQYKAGRTPLHKAALPSNLAILDLLLQIPSIRIDVYDQGGLTPLHQAITQGSEAVVEILVERGADLTLPIKSYALFYKSG